MTLPPHATEPPTQGETEAHARKRARTTALISVLVSVSVIGGAYAVWLPILGQIWLLDIFFLFVPFVRAVTLLGKPSMQNIGMLFAWAFFAPIVVFWLFAKVAESSGAAFSLPKTLAVVAIAQVIPVMLLQRVEFRRLRALK